MILSKNDISSEICRTQTWRGQIIEIKEEDNSIVITFRYLPWLIELFVWNAPFIILLGVIIISHSLNEDLGEFLLLIIIFPFLGFLLIQIFRKNPYEIHSWHKFLLTFYSIVGFNKTLIRIVKEKDNDLEKTSDKQNILSFNDIRGLGYIQSDFFDFAIKDHKVLMALILENDEIVPIGGWYGIFALEYKNQRKNFWTLYSTLADLLDIPIRRGRTKKKKKEICKGKKYYIQKYWFLNGCAYRKKLNEKMQEKKTSTLKFKSKRNYISIWNLNIWMINLFMFFILMIFIGFVFYSLINLPPELLLSFYYGAFFRYMYDFLPIFRVEFLGISMDY